MNDALAICIGVCGVVLASHFLQVGKLNMGFWLAAVAGSVIVAFLLSSRGEAVQELVVGKWLTVKMRDVQRMRDDVYAKAEAVKQLAEKTAALTIYNVGGIGRLAPEFPEYVRQMLKARDDVVLMLREVGSSQARIDEIVEPVNARALADLKGEVRNEVHRSARALKQSEPATDADAIWKELRPLVMSYDREKLTARAKALRVDSPGLQNVLNLLDKFIATKSL